MAFPPLGVFHPPRLIDNSRLCETSGAMLWRLSRHPPSMALPSRCIDRLSFFWRQKTLSAILFVSHDVDSGKSVVVRSGIGLEPLTAPKRYAKLPRIASRTVAYGLVN